MRYPHPEHSTLRLRPLNSTVYLFLAVTRVLPSALTTAGGSKLAAPAKSGHGAVLWETRQSPTTKSQLSKHLHLAPMLALATTMASSGSTVAMVVLTTRVSLSATFTPSTSKRKRGPSTNLSSHRHRCLKVAADTLCSHTTTNSTHTVVGTRRLSITTSLSSI